MMDYSFSYKTELPIEDDWDDNVTHDIFVSAFNSSDRVAKVFNKAVAGEKYWLIFPEYRYEESEVPKNCSFICEGESEGDQIISFFKHVEIDFENSTMCIDITGFMRPQLAFLMKYLFLKGVKKIDFIYSEPVQYSSKENTSFSGGSISEVRQIIGFEGVHSNDTRNDLLVIGSGYDYHLIKSVCNHKENARTVLLLGFPSLRPDMYQENILKTALASDELGAEAMRNPIFAPANDPFVTAEVLSENIQVIDEQLKAKADQGITNIYLCSLATKPQTVGFILYYLKELRDKNVSIIYPFFASYGRETSTGISKIWMYTVEF
jgi:hypothetical protein